MVCLVSLPLDHKSPEGRDGICFLHVPSPVPDQVGPPETSAAMNLLAQVSEFTSPHGLPSVPWNFKLTDTDEAPSCYRALWRELQGEAASELRGL